MPRRAKPPCRRRSSASRDHARAGRRRWHPRSRRDTHRRTGEGDRRYRASRSCPCGYPRPRRPPVRSARARRPDRAKRATPRRRSPAIRETPDSGGGRKGPGVAHDPIYPPDTASEPPSDTLKSVILRAETCQSGIRQSDHLENAGWNATGKQSLAGSGNR